MPRPEPGGWRQTGTEGIFQLLRNRDQTCNIGRTVVSPGYSGWCRVSADALGLVAWAKGTTCTCTSQLHSTNPLHFGGVEYNLGMVTTVLDGKAIGIYQWESVHFTSHTADARREHHSPIATRQGQCATTSGAAAEQPPRAPPRHTSSRHRGRGAHSRPRRCSILSH